LRPVRLAFPNPHPDGGRPIRSFAADDTAGHTLGHSAADTPEWIDAATLENIAGFCERLTGML
jgi:transposase